MPYLITFAVNFFYFAMKSFYIKIIILILMCIPFIGNAQNIHKRGLFFRSFEVNQDKRTSLNLTPLSPLVFPNGFSMQFEIQLRKQDQNFGYVFRIIGNDSINIDFVSDISSNEYLFSLVSGINSLVRVQKTEIKDFKPGSWIKVILLIDPQKNVITLQINNLTKKVFFALKRMRSFELFFGGNSHPKFLTTDIPPMTISNIKIFNSEKNLVRYWKLEKHAVNAVYDECSHEKAVCFNPVWEIDSHVKWRQKVHLTLPYSNPQIAFDEEKELVYIVKGKYVIIYNSEFERIDSFLPTKGEAYNSLANQLVFDKKNRKLISYSFENNTIALFDPKTKEWNNQDSQEILPYYWHHSKYFNTQDSTLFTIGGYGYHKYKGVIMKYSLKDKKWQQHDISATISPRYMGSLGYLGNSELLYFGGYGNKSGNQEEFPRNYYDLYKINERTLEIKKLWEMNVPKDQFANGNSLVVNKEKGSFYTLSYPNGRYTSNIKLNEFSIDKAEYITVGDSIPYKFKDIESYCDLYYCPKSSILLAVTAVSQKNTSEINIYSIAYPPLQEKDVFQEDEAQSIFKWYFLLILIAFIPLIFIIKKRLKKQDDPILVDHVLRFDYKVSENKLKPSTINLLGIFQVMDKDGNNITGSFTQTLSHILVLMILYTVKNEQGISSQELADILWYDKDKDSARNNRNVNFSKLRLLLKKVGNIELINNNHYWSVNIGKDVFCDYKNVMYLIELIHKQHVVSIEIINELLSISSRGVLLPNFEEEWLDNYKGAYTNAVIETLTELFQKQEVKSDFSLMLRISEGILLHDNIDEEAAKFKVYTLYNLGKKGQAKQVYEKFLEDYKNLLGADYKVSFDQFIDVIN